MSDGKLVLAKITKSGEITITGAAQKLSTILATALNIKESDIYYVDQLVAKTGAFTFDYNEKTGTRFAGANYNLNRAKAVDNPHACWIKSTAGDIQVNYVAYLNQLPSA